MKATTAWGKTGNYGVVLLRVLLGAIFILAGASKLLQGDFGSESMLGFFDAKQSDSFAFYRYFITKVVMSAPGFFAALVAFGELTLGLAFVTGSKIRLAAILGIFMLFNFSLAKGSYPWQLGGDQILIVLLALCAYFNAGKLWGVDGILMRKE